MSAIKLLVLLDLRDALFMRATLEAVLAQTFDERTGDVLPRVLAELDRAAAEAHEEARRDRADG